MPPARSLAARRANISGAPPSGAPSTMRCRLSATLTTPARSPCRRNRRRPRRRGRRRPRRGWPRPGPASAGGGRPAGRHDGRNTTRARHSWRRRRRYPPQERRDPGGDARQGRRLHGDDHRILRAEIRRSALAAGVAFRTPSGVWTARPFRRSASSCAPRATTDTSLPPGRDGRRGGRRSRRRRRCRPSRPGLRAAERSQGGALHMVRNEGLHRSPLPRRAIGGRAAEFRFRNIIPTDAISSSALPLARTTPMPACRSEISLHVLHSE